MRVTIFGSGYVGLVTGACLADAGNDVLCVDVDEKKIAGLKQGIVPIHEPGLDALIKANTEAERLRFTTSAQEGWSTDCSSSSRWARPLTKTGPRTSSTSSRLPARSAST